MTRTVIALRSVKEMNLIPEPLPTDEIFLQRGRRGARLIWGVLLKWFKPEFVRRWMKPSLRTVTIDSDSIFDSIRLSRAELQRIYDREAKFVLIGRDQAYQLFGEIESKHYFEGPIQARIGFGNDTRILGMTLVVVPWMEGFVLVPDLKEYAAKR